MNLRPVAALTARYPGAIALLLGVTAALGFEPLHVWPLTLLALAGFLQLIAQASSARQAALFGWLFGLGHFSFGNNWIATAFTYQANMPGWLGWIAVVLLAGYLAVYPMLAALAAWLLACRRAAPRKAALVPPLILALAGSWIITEWLRSWVFTGFSWNPLGMVALGPFGRPGLALLSRITGTYGLSGLVMLLAGLWWTALRRKRLDWRAAALVALPALALFQPFAFAAREAPGGLAFTLIQPDIRQEVLNDPAHFNQQFVRSARLSQREKADGRRLVLWPESGVPDYLRGGYPAWLYEESTFAADPARARQRLGAAIGPGSLLLTGAIDLDIGPAGIVGARNVVTVVDEHGTIRGSYAKAHLVPYGEYLPMREVLEPLGLSRLVPGSLDFQPGPGPRTLDLGPWGKVGVQLCYEIIFSGQVADRAHRPDFLFNPTNDGWFGTFGPPQHLAQARMRAIEEGLPVLRATTTGISAVIGADGQVRSFLPRHQAGRLQGFVPRDRVDTPFSRHGNLLPLCWAVVFLLLSPVATRRRHG